MKNTEKEIIERFQKFDFDPDKTKENQIFNKITSAHAVKRRPKRLVFAFVAAFSVLIAVVLIHKDKNQLIESDSGTYVLQNDAFQGVMVMNEEEKAVTVNVLVESADSAMPISESQKEMAPKRAEAEKLSIAEERRAVEDVQRLMNEKEKAEPANVLADSVGSVMTKKEMASKREKAREFSIAEERRAVAMARVEMGRVLALKAAADKSAAPAASANMNYIGQDYNSLQDESYKKYEENTFRSTISDPLSTFSADVDVASYNIMRRFIMSGSMPNPDSVRIEEMLNYFNYSYPQPKGKDPVSMNFEYTDSPWNKGLKLVKIGVKAKDIKKAELPPSNLVFLIDVSGSMSQENRLPLVKKSLKMLVDELRPEDRVSIVTYASGTNELLSGAKGSEKEKIMQIIDNLNAGGGTYGAGGLALAYEVAKKNFIRKGNNRIILATDGDFNIGPSSESELENQIVAARESGVFLSVLGYGMGNYKDSKVQTLANKGNGNYAYINDLFEARKTLVKEFGATLFTVAKDVKLQVEFNPAYVAAYRLVGYEKIALNTQDFNDDKKDAGEMGAGHTVTVIYEIIPAGVESEFMPDIESLKYTKVAASSDNGDVLTLKLRYKDPDSDTSKLMEKQLKQKDYVPFSKTSDDMRFAVSVAQFGQIVKDSQYKGNMTIDEVISTAKKAKGADDDGYRADFIKMLEMYKMIK
ncbi:MAG: von Willebrand factor type A domain-containing protein [Endomicrobia bacterium]|nr:von Willebrand factor type A domain-containing protein [Endomicrobiia bacterium]